MRLGVLFRKGYPFMITKRLVSGVAAASLGAGGLVTAASAIHTDSKPADPKNATHADIATSDSALSLAPPAITDSGPADASNIVAPDSQTDNVGQGAVDNTDQGRSGDGNQSDSGS